MAPLFIASLIACAGCNAPQADGASSPMRAGGDEEGVKTAGDDIAAVPPAAIRGQQPPTGFGPAKISILPLTEPTAPSGGGRDYRLNVYVALIDAFSSQIKAPGTWRFELYEYVPRSAERKGQRLAIWPDVDLVLPAENHRYWRDFLRAYEFELDMPADPGRPYVLEVTCACPDGRRLSGEYLLRSGS